MSTFTPHQPDPAHGFFLLKGSVSPATIASWGSGPRFLLLETNIIVTDADK